MAIRCKLSIVIVNYNTKRLFKKTVLNQYIKKLKIYPLIYGLLTRWEFSKQEDDDAIKI